MHKIIQRNLRSKRDIFIFSIKGRKNSVEDFRFPIQLREREFEMESFAFPFEENSSSR